MISTLRAALSTFDFDQLAWAAEGFAAQRYVEGPAALTELLTHAEQSNPADHEAVLRAAMAIERWPRRGREAPARTRRNASCCVRRPLTAHTQSRLSG